MSGGNSGWDPRKLSVIPADLVEAGYVVRGNEHHVARGIRLLLSLLYDSPLGGSKPVSVHAREYRFWTTQHYAVAVRKRAELADRLLKAQSLYGESAEDAKDELDALYGEFRRTPLTKEYLEWYSNGNVACFRYIYSYLTFLAKAKYEDQGLWDAAENTWRETEEALTAFVLPVDRDIADLKAIIAELLPEPLKFRPADLQFGPGSVADVRKGRGNPARKAEALARSVPLRIKRLVERDSPDVADAMWKSLGTFGTTGGKGSFGGPLFSKRTVVHKNYKTGRTISMEQNYTMLVQQAQKAEAYRQIRRGPMRHFVDLEDQTLSRDAALRGSEDGHVDTIDLSAASDRVHADLVRTVFPVQWAYPLFLSRSSSVITREGPVSVKKFAPMGSALCFPVQCVIFTAICLLVYQRQLEISVDEGCIVSAILSRCELTHARSKRFSGRYSPPRIYGDDIICDARATGDVMMLLEKFGFRVNRDKSFMGGMAVREACGIYALAGSDITPIRYAISISGENLSASSYAGLISLANRAFEYGYLELRRRVITVLRDELHDRANYLPFVSDPDHFGIYTPGRIAPPKVAAGSPHRYMRWNKGYQRGEVKTLCVKMVGDSADELADGYWVYPATKWRKEIKIPRLWNYENYLYFLSQNRAGRKPSHFHPVIKWLEEKDESGDRLRPCDLRFEWKWTPIR